MRIRAIGVLMALAMLLSGCAALSRSADPCSPVDPGGECFAPSPDAFAAHALTSATAWPQLAGLGLVAGDAIPAQDTANGQPTWIVPLRADGRVVAASRFLPVGDQVRLAEVALYTPGRADFPAPGPGERLVLAPASCGDPIAPTCLFRELGWRIDRG